MFPEKYSKTTTSEVQRVSFMDPRSYNTPPNLGYSSQLRKAHLHHFGRKNPIHDSSVCASAAGKSVYPFSVRSPAR
jgi:hypothetical protein